ncbi:MAG: hypothetical protein WBR26_25380, partial [Candidatus Acidiferrum sp.]
MSGVQGGFSTGTGIGGGASTFGSSFGSSSFGSSSFGSSGIGSNQNGTATQNGAVGTALANGTNGTPGANGNGTDDQSSDPGQPHSIAGPMDASNTIGGNIIGVGSKIDKPSFMIYKKAKVYKKFEFIWDPSQDQTMGRASTGIGAPIGNSNGMTPAGANGMNPAGSNTFTSPFSSGINGQNPGQNGNPAQNQNPGSNPDPNQQPPLQAPPQQ